MNASEINASTRSPSFLRSHARRLAGTPTVSTRVALARSKCCDEHRIERFRTLRGTYTRIILAKISLESRCTWRRRKFRDRFHGTAGSTWCQSDYSSEMSLRWHLRILTKLFKLGQTVRRIHLDSRTMVNFSEIGGRKLWRVCSLS